MKFTWFWVKITHASKIWIFFCELHSIESASHAFKDLVQWQSFIKKHCVFYSNEHFHNKNDTQVYCGINSLHKRLNPKNLKHKIMKGRIWTQSSTHNPLYIWKNGQIIIPIDACIEHSHSSTTSQYIMSHTNISKLPSFYGWIIILFEIYL
jgi:hypothetical protein